ncbi:hypothetical protein N7532_008908 [Penicillium argentinense]|uniref:alpha-1,2-Mannosidase n=1 Tax=Penicillium argentinense TaxID=1131581 RepID=A0A9W9K215_9EURO|nr:uncharacterized protein N7532_008908 [Penicillium argentinense]KAJ5090224.1 hypothetical protein N7532_008908 [Penicillium argentinense]
MITSRKGRSLTTSVFLLFVAYLFLVWLPLHRLYGHHRPTPIQGAGHAQNSIHLNNSTERYPVTSYFPLPTSPGPLPRIQYDFPAETKRERKARLKKQETIKRAFLHAWNGYKNHAWMRDEVSPSSGRYQDSFSGWGATLVDSLDALVIMGLDDELEVALDALEQVDFTTTPSSSVNVFEIIIRYMGGMIAAHDLTNGKHPILLKKAVELGEMIYNAFDTHNRMPQMRWEWSRSAQNLEIIPSDITNLAELGSLTVEFTRLSQLTGDPKYFDAVQRITNELEKSQTKTRLPGLWPNVIDADRLSFDGPEYSLGGCADSAYEYLPKEHILLGGQTDQYRSMYEKSIEAIKKHMLFRPMLKDEHQKILFTSNLVVNRGGRIHHKRYVQEHLKCFLGGTVGIAAKIFKRSEDMSVARQLTDGCIWAYDTMPTGIMPESMEVVACKGKTHCPFDQNEWYEGVLGQSVNSASAKQQVEKLIDHESLPAGVTVVRDSTYKLRPEALESIFIMYRITGDKSLQNAAWRMFQRIDKATRTKFGHSSIDDVRDIEPKLSDKMESFWLAETLKYLYLIFSEPDHISLDEYVLSTEAHPFKRPTKY